MQLICAFVFAYAKNRFSHDATHEKKGFLMKHVYSLSGASSISSTVPGQPAPNFQQSPFQTASATVPSAAPFPNHARIPNNVPKGGKGGKQGKLALTHELYEPHHVKTCLWGFRPGKTQTGLYNNRRWLDA